MKRRDFLKASLTSAVALTMDQSQLHAGPKTSEHLPPLPRRPYGPDAIELSVIGFGGIVVKDAEPEHAKRVVAEAVERGINYFDVAPTYGDAEEKLGPALEPYRKNVFLACKTGQRTAERAQEEFDRSRQRLRTDYFDLYQLHDWKPRYPIEESIETMALQQEQGKTRYIGVSNFNAEQIGRALSVAFFHSNQPRYNLFDRHIEDSIIPFCRQKGIGILAHSAEGSALATARVW